MYRIEALYEDWLRTAPRRDQALKRERAAEAVVTHLPAFIAGDKEALYRDATRLQFHCFCNWQGSAAMLDKARQIACASGCFAVVARAGRDKEGAWKVYGLHWLHLAYQGRGLLYEVYNSRDFNLMPQYYNLIARLRTRRNYGTDVVWGDRDVRELLGLVDRARSLPRAPIFPLPIMPSDPAE